MRWINCPSHSGADVTNFLNQHFSENGRQVLLVGGAGFDPRARILPLQLDSILGERLDALLLKEERPETTTDLVLRADENKRILIDQLSNVRIEPIDVLSADLSVVGARLAVRCLASELSDAYSDVVLDLSALSSGIGFPLVRYSLEWVDKKPKRRELHILVAAHPTVDNSVRAMPLDKSREIFGFKGHFGLESTSNAAKLWLPQLAYDQRHALSLIYDEVQPHDVCPVLPFPSRKPRESDCLLEYFGNEILNIWEVAPKNVILAAEGNPLDLYRTILRIDDERAVVFEETGGSQLLLTPSGSKALTIGALLAAIERDLPVRHVESMGYRVEWQEVDQVTEDQVELLHLWLAGKPYSGIDGVGTD